MLVYGRPCPRAKLSERVRKRGEEDEITSTPPRRKQGRREATPAGSENERSDAAAALEVYSSPASTAGRTACHRRPRPAALSRPPRRPALLGAPPPPVLRRPDLPSKPRRQFVLLRRRRTRTPSPKFMCSLAARSRLPVTCSAAASRGSTGSGEVVPFIHSSQMVRQRTFAAALFFSLVERTRRGDRIDSETCG
jgi:hypothetical protein